MIPRRLLFLLYIVLFSAFTLGAGALFLDAQAEYKALKQQRAANEVRLAAAQARLQEKQRILERLKSDPQFVEKEIRKRLGYSRPGEWIFRFED